MKRYQINKHIKAKIGEQIIGTDIMDETIIPPGTFIRVISDPRSPDNEDMVLLRTGMVFDPFICVENGELIGNE
jgi:hypothetical protein